MPSTRPTSIRSGSPGNKGGESETIIGKWLKARGGRDKVVIATKVGIEMPGIGQGLSKDYIIAARSRNRCKRLQTDYIDLYQSHTDDKSDAARGDARRLRRADRGRARCASSAPPTTRRRGWPRR